MICGFLFGLGLAIHFGPYYFVNFLMLVGSLGFLLCGGYQHDLYLIGLAIIMAYQVEHRVGFDNGVFTENCRRGARNGRIS